MEERYGKNSERLTTRFSKAVFRKEDWDPLRGAVIIELEGPTLVGSIAVWFKGDIAVPVLKEGSDTPVWLEDRVLTPGEDVSSVLDVVLRKIEEVI
jgi:hypothetical protein